MNVNVKMKFKIAEDLAGVMVEDRPAVELPSYANPGDACFDLRAIVLSVSKIPQYGFISPGGFRTLRTGLIPEIPPGFCLQIFSRSGHGFKHGVRLRNGTGIIDSGYRGELMVSLANDGDDSFKYEHGDRIAQAWLIPVPVVQFELVDELSETIRGAGGLGSTGK